ncbi:rhomboid family intramembrane serine protease [Protofrankia coriariae]|nr:rhomboid family intramembrane serine protease [Protofrankia coriariae]
MDAGAVRAPGPRRHQLPGQYHASGQPPEPAGWRPADGSSDPSDGWTPDAPSATGSRPTGQPDHGSAAHPRPAPYCYRHADRETYVSCQRCGRPICPECMRPAAVGFHCPEEGAAASRRGATSRRPINSLGGQARIRHPGLITQLLIGLCVAAYALQGLPGLSGSGPDNTFTLDYSLYGPGIAANDEYYRLLTAAFLHAGVLHILFNMYALYLLGSQLEQILGRVRYLALFVVCAIGGNTLSYLINGWNTFSVGASTAVFGFFAAYYVIARRLRADTSAILIIVGINLIITFTIARIDKWGHIGGLVTGLVVGVIYAYVPTRRGWAQAVAVGAVLAALLLAAALRTSAVTSTPLSAIVQ